MIGSMSAPHEAPGPSHLDRYRRDGAGSQTRQTRPSSQYRRLIVFELLQNLTHHRSSHFNTMNNEYYELLIHKNSSLDFLLMSMHHLESSFFVTLDSNNIRSTHFLFGENQFRGGLVKLNHNKYQIICSGGTKIKW